MSSYLGFYLSYPDVGSDGILNQWMDSREYADNKRNPGGPDLQLDACKLPTDHPPTMR